MSNNIKIAIAVAIIVVLVIFAAGIIYYVKNKITVYDKDGMIYENTKAKERGDD